MPKFDASHELDMKRKRQAERGQHKQVWRLTPAVTFCGLSTLCSSKPIIGR